MTQSRGPVDNLCRYVLGHRFSLPRDEGRSKVVPLAEAVRQQIREGMSLHFLGLHYRSHAAIYELLRQFGNRRPNFTIVAGTLHGPIMALFHAGMVTQAVTAFTGEAYPTMGPNPIYNRISREHGIVLEHWSFLTFTLRLLAGALGVGFLPTRSLVGSDMAAANTNDCQHIEDPFGQVSGLAAVRALNPDVAIVHGQAADKFGNTILLPPRGEDVYGAFGSLNGVIVTVEKIVTTDYIRRHSHLVKLPGLFVRSVSEVPMGAHPSGMNTHGLPEIDAYCEDIPFYVEAREAAREPRTFNSWIKKWILDCADHDAYLRTLGSERVHLLKGRSHPNAWWYDMNGKIPEIARRSSAASRLERAVLAASDIMRNKVAHEDCRLILVGAGLASLAGWVAIYGLKEQGAEAEVISELGFMGFAPRPGEPFLFNLSNIPTCKQLDGILTMLGMMVPNDKLNCLAALSAAQVDRFGNLNTTAIPEKKVIMTGSGGANDVMSTAKEVLIVMPQSKDRFVEKLPFITSPGTRAKTLVSTLGVFEKLRDDKDFTLTAYFEDQLPEQQDLAVREIREQCGWDLKVADSPKMFPRPDETDLVTLRMFDPDRYLLRDS